MRPARLLLATLAVLASRLVRSLPARAVPAVLLPLRYRYHLFVVPTGAIAMKHGGPGRDNAAIGRALNRALRWKFVVDGDWDVPGRPIGMVRGVERTPLYRSMQARGFQRLGPIRAVARGGIQVCVARDGRLVLFNEGHHRLTAARLLGIERLPVYVRGVHVAWCEAVERSCSSSQAEDLDHGLNMLSRSTTR